MYDTLIKGATLVDGLGGPAVTGDLAIAGGRIAAVGGRITGAARETLDAGGALVTPALRAALAADDIPEDAAAFMDMVAARNDPAVEALSDAARRWTRAAPW